MLLICSLLKYLTKLCFKIFWWLFCTQNQYLTWLELYLTFHLNLTWTLTWLFTLIWLWNLYRMWLYCVCFLAYHPFVCFFFFLSFHNIWCFVQDVPMIVNSFSWSHMPWSLFPSQWYTLNVFLFDCFHLDNCASVFILMLYTT